MPTSQPPRSTPAPTQRPNAKPSRPPTSHSPPSPCPAGQPTEISSNGSTRSADNRPDYVAGTGPGARPSTGNTPARPHNPAVHIMAQDVRGDRLVMQGRAG